MPNYKLVYFNGRGRAETVRLTFAASGIKYDDHRIEKEKWSELKPKTFAGYLPYLEVDGKVLVESMAIARFVAREGGLSGKCNFEQGQIDGVVDILSGLLEKGATLKHSPEGPHKEALHKDFTEKTFPATVKLLEKFLDSHHYFVENKLSLADLHFYSVFENLATFFKEWPKHSPKLKEHYDRVAALPKIAEYLKSRPETPF